MRYLYSSFLTVFVMACEGINIVSSDATIDKISGNYVLTGVFLGDVMDQPCGWEAEGKNRDITLVISNDTDTNPVDGTSEKAYKLSGQSAVNSFFSSVAILGFDKATQRGTIKVGGVGSTKMAGEPALMNCEQRYFELLNAATQFEIQTVDDETRLIWGRLKEPNSPPSRDGGTYLIFKKL